MAIILTVAIEKGGAGKTTTVVNLAALMAQEGKRVLAVDIDKQANTTAQLTGFDEYEGHFAGCGVFDLIRSFDMDTGRFVAKTKIEGIDLIPANRDVELIPAMEELFKAQRRGEKFEFLSRALAGIEDNYDYIIIDTPPSNPDLTRNALLASDYVVIPLNLTQSNVSGLYGIYGMCEDIVQNHGGAAEILGILMTRVRANLNLVKNIRSQIEASDWGKDLFAASIRESALVQESESFYQPVVTYDPASRPSQDYREFYEELKQRIQAAEKRHEEEE